MRPPACWSESRVLFHAAVIIPKLAEVGVPTSVCTRSRKNASHTRTHSSRAAASPQRAALALGPPFSELRCRLRRSGQRGGAELSACRPTPWCCTSGASHACAKRQAHTLSLSLSSRTTNQSSSVQSCVRASWAACVTRVTAHAGSWHCKLSARIARGCTSPRVPNAKNRSWTSCWAGAAMHTLALTFCCSNHSSPFFNTVQVL